jgi:hypothetical protein
MEILIFGKEQHHIPIQVAFGYMVMRTVGQDILTPAQPALGQEAPMFQIQHQLIQ